MQVIAPEDHRGAALRMTAKRPERNIEAASLPQALWQQNSMHRILESPAL